MTVHRDEPNWLTTEHEIDPSLPDGFPGPVLRRRPRDAYQHVGAGGWTGYWPPEDLAVPPDVEWTEAHRILVLAAYQKKWGRFLESNQTYEIKWPPEPSLVGEGYAPPGSLVCVDHDEEDCVECHEFHEVSDGEVQPAEWTWSVVIETYEWDEGSGCPEHREYFRFLTTWMDPRDVDYEPFATSRH